MPNRFWENAYRTTVVCVDSCENDVWVGRLYNPYWETGATFHSLMQFLLKIEELLDEMQFPQSFTAARAFTAPPLQRTVAPPASEPQEGKCGTFSLRILFRQNASWQGSVTWLEGKGEESFRSALELIFLMDSALKSTARGSQKSASASGEA